jgi:hypothetical protein
MHNQTPNPDGQRVNTLLYRRFPYREIGGCGVERFMQHKTPNPETPMHATYPPLALEAPLNYVTSFARVIRDRGIVISSVAIFLHYKTPNPDSPMPPVSIPW